MLVERIDRPQVDVVFHAPAAERPQFLEQERCGNDGRPGVEGEAILPMDIGSAPGRVELFENGDPVAAGAQPDSRSEAAETASDDDRSGTGIDAWPSG